jgi:hypothetical protein
VTDASISTEHPPASRDRRAIWLSYLYALVAALVLGHFLLGIPIQLSDSFGNMLKLVVSWPELLYNEFTQRAYLRPLLWAELKVVYDLSGGNYYAWFRGTHVAQVVALALLYVAIVRPQTLRDAALIPFGIAVLFGTHTFAGTVNEAFPINTFLTILLFSFAAMYIALTEYRRWHDLAAPLLFAGAALTVESGLLVWVVIVGARLVGARGVSRGGIAVLVVLLGVYFGLRFLVLNVGSAGLEERSSGFGFGILEPDELIARFGSNPVGFYAYNIIASVLSVLVSEPSSGVFVLTRAVMQGTVDVSMFVKPIATLSVTALLGVFAWRRRHVWLSRRFDHDDRLVLIFGMVLAANAVISYPYTKDVIVSVAGALFALAAFAAARRTVAWLPDTLPRHRIAGTMLIALVSGAWSLQAAAMHLELRSAAYAQRQRWAYAELTLEDDLRRFDARERALFRTLRDEALFAGPEPPPLDLGLDTLLRTE